MSAESMANRFGLEEIFLIKSQNGLLLQTQILPICNTWWHAKGPHDRAVKVLYKVVKN
jgi:hypothetical protein